MFGSKEEKKVAEEISISNNGIGKGTVLEGNLESFGNIRIDGKVIGNVKTKSKVVLGQSSYMEGNVLAQNAEIEGEVKGVIEVSDILVLKATCVINGDIFTNKLVIESGAKFNGQCKMNATIKEIKIGDENGIGSANSFDKKYEKVEAKK
jgi:cytoskeletal protein CcmA (bactofilin family)